MSSSASPPASAAAEDGLDRSTWIVAGVVLLGAVMSILDTTVINVAIDRLAVDFKPRCRPSSGWSPATRWR